MPGITNITSNLNMGNITFMANSSNPVEFMIKVNHVVYDGYMFFILLFILWFVIFAIAQAFEKQPWNNIMMGGAAVSVIALFIRVGEVYILGINETWVMITDTQLWVFPILTIIIATFLWMVKKE